LGGFLVLTGGFLMLKQLAGLLLGAGFCFAAGLSHSQGQTVELLLRIAPDGYTGGRGLDVDMNLTLTSTKAEGKVTMHGKGRDGCRLQSTPVAGEREGETPIWNIRTVPTNNLECPTIYTLNQEAGWAGRYKGSNGEGNVKKR
jgi:hypothetical protein